ncbi:MAG: DUF1800 domain-containing protein [Chitinophagales bacterium]|nr:DUF1800 domain-containing protein [Chitinophagales bacterium]
MGDVKLSRRRFFEKLTPTGGGVRIEPVEPLFPENSLQADDQHFSQQFTLQGGLDPYQGPWTQAEATHLLRRTTFGVKYAHVQQLLALGSADAAVDAILTVSATVPDPPINNYNNLNAVPPAIDPNVPLGQTWINAPYNVEFEGARIESWRGWWLDRMIEGEANIQEKMTLFWHNHFATQTDAVFRGKAAYLHNQMLRRNALGNFRTFVKEVTLDPLMLVFLNGYLNNLIAPDENYARELQELFTVGKDSPVTYTEDDVVAAARVLTGWTFNNNEEVVFVPQLHDQGFKVFSSFYGNAIIQGSTNGSAELDALINMILQKEEVSLYICRKIYRFFVYYNIDQDVEANVIVPMAQIFRDNNYEIKPVMEALLKSEHFFDAVNKGCMIKNPLDLLVGLLRNFNLSLPEPTLYDNYSIRLGINFFCGALQMLPGSPPNVAGWSAYRQLPTYYRNWISADTIRNRNLIADIMAFAGADVGPEKLIINHIAFAAQFPNPGDPNALIDDTLAILYPMPISLIKKFYLKSILLSGQASDHYWTDAWNAFLNNPTDPMAVQTVWFRLATMHKYIMNLAEYQLS